MTKVCPICNTSYPDTNAFCTNDGATLRSEEKSQDLVGSVIADRYRIEKLLGEGGMGRVYLAQHVRLPQKAAIKVLHPSMVTEVDAVARFNREAANAAKIDHDRVARVFDYGDTSDGLVFLAMEFVPGRTLRDMIGELGKLPPARAANITFQIAEGLDAAHRIGIIHRDLKPDNVLVVTDDNGVDRSKVVDFGIAKAVDNSQTQLTQTGMLVGTPEFMSPEQVLGEQLDARSDVYALALVAYQLFTGGLPFGGTTPERSLAARLMEDAKPLSFAAADVEWPSALQDAFDRALARDPADRTATAIEFGDSVVAATEAWLGASVLRGRTPLSNPSLVGIATLTPTGVSTTSPTPSVPSQTTGGTRASIPTGAPAVVEPVARKTSRVPVIAGGVVVLVVAFVAGLVFMNGRKTGSATVMPSLIDQSTPQAVAAVSGPTVPVVAAERPVQAESRGNPPAGAAQSPPAQQPPSNPPTNPPAAVTADNSAATSPGNSQILDLLREDVQNAADASAAEPLIVRLNKLLPQLRQPSDSFNAYMALFEAHLTSGHSLTLSCPSLQAADKLARQLTSSEQKSVNYLFEQTGCTR